MESLQSENIRRHFIVIRSFYNIVEYQHTPNVRISELLKQTYGYEFTPYIMRFKNLFPIRS
ncbi:MAG: hypothetical protein ACLS6Y_08300 [Streptococcus salivarius]